MSFKKYVEKKKEDWSKYQMKRDAMKQERERNESMRLKLDAQRAREDMGKLREQNKQRKQIKEYKDYKRESRGPSKFGSMMSSVSAYATKMDSGRSKSKSDSIMGSSMNFGGSSGKSDMFSGMFGGPAPQKKRKKTTKRKPKSKSKSKSKGKTITIRMS